MGSDSKIVFVYLCEYVLNVGHSHINPAKGLFLKHFNRQRKKSKDKKATVSWFSKHCMTVIINTCTKQWQNF